MRSRCLWTLATYLRIWRTGVQIMHVASSLCSTRLSFYCPEYFKSRIEQLGSCKCMQIPSRAADSANPRGLAARIWCPLSKLWPPWNPGAVVSPLTRYRTHLCRKFSLILRRCGNLKEECRYVARTAQLSNGKSGIWWTLKTPNKRPHKFGLASSAMRSFAP